MNMPNNTFSKHLFPALLSGVLLASFQAMAATEPDQAGLARSVTTTTTAMLAAQASVGDIVFIRVNAKPFREVATATNSWTNHVGVVVDTTGAEPLIGESTFPLSRITTLSKFIARSEGGRVAVARIRAPLSKEQQQNILLAAIKREGVFYDTGFDLHSSRQFCSRFVREVLIEATGISVGEVETFQTLFARNPETNLGFWKMWYFGQIPWERETVTPASLLLSEKVRLTFDGTATVFAANTAALN